MGLADDIHYAFRQQRLERLRYGRDLSGPKLLKVSYDTYCRLLHEAFGGDDVFWWTDYTKDGPEYMGGPMRMECVDAWDGERWEIE